jgi:amidohydrolase
MQPITIKRRMLVGASLLVAFAMSAAAHAASLEARIDQILEDRGEGLIELRRDLHRHPELAGEEKRTAGIVAERLRALGLEVRTGVGGHGVVGILRGELDGPVVAYRADMDAMASDAADPVSFASEIPGVRHICGHDMHVTVALGIAEVLATARDQLAGTVKFLFQPAEESAEGARAMIADGALRDPVPAGIFAVHCAPLSTGQFGSQVGMMLPGLDLVRLTLSGDGDLSAAADACSQVIASVSTTAGMAPPQNTSEEALDAALVPGAFISAGIFASGPEGDGWVLTGMARASSEAMHARAKKGIVDGLAALELGGVRYELEYTEGAIAAVNNDATLVGRSEEIIRSCAGGFGGDDAFFQRRLCFLSRAGPGRLVFHGCFEPGERHPGNAPSSNVRGR